MTGATLEASGAQRCGMTPVRSVTLLCHLRARCCPLSVWLPPSQFPDHYGNGRNARVTSIVTFEVTVSRRTGGAVSCWGGRAGDWGGSLSVAYRCGLTSAHQKSNVPSGRRQCQMYSRPPDPNQTPRLSWKNLHPLLQLEMLVHSLSLPRIP